MFVRAERKDLQNDLLRIRGSVHGVNKYLPPASRELGTDLGAWKLVRNQMDGLPFSSEVTGDGAQWKTGPAHINK